MFRWISALTLATALLFVAPAPVLAQSSDAGGPAEQAMQMPPQAERGFWGRTWDRMRGRGNPKTEAGQQFHEERREQLEAGKARREQEREERRDDHELDKAERERERAERRAEHELDKAERRSEGYVDEDDRDRVKRVKRPKVKRAKKVHKAKTGRRDRDDY